MINEIIDLAKRDERFREELLKSILENFYNELDEYFMNQYVEEGLIGGGA